MPRSRLAARDTRARWKISIVRSRDVVSFLNGHLPILCRSTNVAATGSKTGCPAIVSRPHEITKRIRIIATVAICFGLLLNALFKGLASTSYCPCHRWLFVIVCNGKILRGTINLKIITWVICTPQQRENKARVTVGFLVIENLYLFSFISPYSFLENIEWILYNMISNTSTL